MKLFRSKDGKWLQYVEWDGQRSWSLVDDIQKATLHPTFPPYLRGAVELEPVEAYATKTIHLGHEPAPAPLEPLTAAGKTYFQRCIGHKFTPTTYGKFTATHPDTVQKTMAQYKDLPVADVVACLVWEVDLARMQRDRFSKEADNMGSWQVRGVVKAVEALVEGLKSKTDLTPDEKGVMEAWQVWVKKLQSSAKNT